jgi:hypothetical protein
MKDEKKLTYNY